MEYTHKRIYTLHIEYVYLKMNKCEYNKQISKIDLCIRRRGNIMSTV